jgi:hypothetical protein
MEKLEIEPSLNKTAKAKATTIESSEVNLTSEATCLKKIKPRAIIFKASDKDFYKIKDSIEKLFPEVEIIYVTTGPVACVLRVVKSMPFEMQESSMQPYYSIE